MRELLIIAAFLAALLPCGAGLGFPTAQASGTAEDGTSSVKGLQDADRDVEVTFIGLAPGAEPFAHEGDTVTILIGVSNNGPAQEEFDVSLRDVTADAPIGSQPVTLASGEATTVSIDWDTTGASGGPPPGPEVDPPTGAVHRLTATATLAGDADDSNNSRTFEPGIWVIASPTVPEIEFLEGKVPAAWETSDLESEEPPLNTEAATIARVYAGPTRGQRTLIPSNPAVSTGSIPLGALFREGALSEEEENLRRPDIATVAAQAETGTIRGRVKLEGRNSSLGSYLEIGSQVIFADRRGYFVIQRPAGNFDLAIKAPGYLALEMYNLNVEAGEVLVVPAVTLSFGDADGNGVIDIYDLTVAAGNYGQTVADLPSR